MNLYTCGATSRRLKNTAVFFASALCLMTQTSPSHAKDFGEYGKVTADLRIRYENVDEEARPREGVAKTARVRLGYQTPEWNNLYAFGEVESIRHLGATSFDDSLNGKTSFGRINDPELNDLNQLYINYTFAEDSMVRLGRQGILMDNSRFVAWSKMRQNDSTHDAALIKFSPTKDLNLTYVYSQSFNRPNGRRATSGRFEGDIHLANAHYDWQYGLGITAYSYWLNFDGVIAEENLSSRTHGLRGSWAPKGDGWQPLAVLDVAKQSAFGHSALNYDEYYTLAEAGVNNDGIKIIGTYERLGGDGTAAMQTPIGSSHNLTGCADKFSTIPVDGLRDMRVNLTVPYDLPWKDQKIELNMQYHILDSDNGDINYGTEADVILTYTPIKNHSVQAKFADYHADEFSSDTQKIWLTYEYKF